MQFSGHFKGKTPILRNFWAQAPWGQISAGPPWPKFWIIRHWAGADPEDCPDPFRPGALDSEAAYLSHIAVVVIIVIVVRFLCINLLHSLQSAAVFFCLEQVTYKWDSTRACKAAWTRRWHNTLLKGDKKGFPLPGTHGFEEVREPPLCIHHNVGWICLAQMFADRFSQCLCSRIKPVDSSNRFKSIALCNQRRNWLNAITPPTNFFKIARNSRCLQIYIATVFLSLQMTTCAKTGCM